MHHCSSVPVLDPRTQTSDSVTERQTGTLREEKGSELKGLTLYSPTYVPRGFSEDGYPLDLGAPVVPGSEIFFYRTDETRSGSLPERVTPENSTPSGPGRNLSPLGSRLLRVPCSRSRLSLFPYFHCLRSTGFIPQTLYPLS